MTKANPLVSVITPTLNSAAFIRDLIACIDHQDYPSVEHIVVDGCSQDGTAEFLRGCDPARHTVFVRKDRSMYDAINYGIQQAHGDIIACLNADDLYFPETVRTVVEFFRRNPHVDIAYGDQLSLFTQTGSFDPYVMMKEYSDPWGRTLVYISQPAVFVRRHVFDRVGLFDADLKGAGDFDFWIRAYRKGVVFKKFRGTWVMVRMHGNNLQFSEKWQQEHEQLKDRYLSGGWSRTWAEAYRLLLRKLTVNRFTVPFLTRLPPAVRFDRSRYFQFLLTRRPTPAPILSVNLPYFQYQAFRALNLGN